MADEALRADVLTFLAGQMDGVSGTRVENEVAGRRERVREVLRGLVAEGLVTTRRGPRGATLHLLVREDVVPRSVETCAPPTRGPVAEALAPDDGVEALRAEDLSHPFAPSPDGWGRVPTPYIGAGWSS